MDFFYFSSSGLKLSQVALLSPLSQDLWPLTLEGCYLHGRDSERKRLSRNGLLFCKIMSVLTPGGDGIYID